MSEFDLIKRLQERICAPAAAYRRQCVVGIGDDVVEGSLARKEPHVGHADHRQPIEPVGAHHATRWESCERRRVTTGQHTDPSSVLDDVDTLRWGPLVVISERSERTGQGCVGGDVHQRGPVPVPMQFRQLEVARTCERRLPTEDPVQLDRVADRLMACGL